MSHFKFYSALIQLLVQLKENMKIKITTDEYQLNFN